MVYPPAPAAPTRSPDAVQHVLLVEDSDDDAALICAELAKAQRPLAFRRVANEESMRAALVEQTWDLVISDNRMPGFDALRAYRLLRRSDQDAPFVIVSGERPDQATMAAMELGANDFVDKTDRARLIPVVERELRYVNLRRAKAEIERALVHLTYHDSLTDLPNRDMLAKLVEHSLHASPAPPARAALLFVDLYRFIRVNESLGYAAGDELLRSVARRLAESLGSEAFVARPGQDKFALYVENVTGLEDAIARARTVGDALARPFVVTGEEMFVACSIGLCLYPQHAEDAGALLRNAESAMSEAKKLGPNTLKVFTATPIRTPGGPLRLESALRHAVERDELFVHYQPVVDAGTTALTGAEALVRWRHPDHGVMPPDTFIELADETGLIVEIGRHVLRTACRQNRLWHDNGLAGMTIAVNVSAAQFRQPDFAHDVAEILAETGLDGRFLELEITETVVMRDAETTIRTLRALKDMGVQIAIDDFGTGYSSLAYLKQFPISMLKIDKSFVHGLTYDQDDQAIVHTIIALAKSLKLGVVAEGVESLAQLDFLRAHRCDRVQGYLIGKPADPARMFALASLATLESETS